MDLDSRLRSAESDPQQLEQLFREARQRGMDADFRAALLARYRDEQWEVVEKVSKSEWFPGHLT